MAVRIIITIVAVRGKGNDVALLLSQRCSAVCEEPGCQQYEVFQSASDPDRLTLLELWEDQAALDAHAALSPPPSSSNALVAETTWREDYEFARVR